MKKTKELSALSPQDLQNRLLELEKELMKQRAQVAMGTPPKKSSSIRDVKKHVARINTAIEGGKKHSE